MTNDSTDTKTPAAFLADLGNVLKARDGVDAQLAEIIATHMLTVSPGTDAVDLAAKAIRTLARTRAASAVEVSNE